MSHNYSVRCVCGDRSESYNHAEEQLIELVKNSHPLYLLSLTGWKENINELSYYHGLAEFVIEHFPHGGFSVKGEYGSDTAVEIVPNKLGIDDNRYYENVVTKYLKTELNSMKKVIESLEKRLDK